MFLCSKTFLSSSTPVFKVKQKIFSVLSKSLSINTEFTSNSDLTMNSNKFQLPKRYQGSSPSVWNEYIKLAATYKPLNLGQGFTDYPVPTHVTDTLSKIPSGDNCLLNQYTRGFGHPRLVNALAKLYSTVTGITYDPLSEVLVTVGAYEALYSAIQGHIDDGDEVIIIEPFFDSYEPVVKICGGISKFIALQPNKTGDYISSADWVLDMDELEKLFSNKTKMIILNTPNNPLGKVFTRNELEKIAALCIKWDALCISDEVYEWLVFDNNEHVRICTLPNMRERTITIGSAGKTFSVTGWKTGWAYGPAALMENLQMVHQNSVYTCPTPIQEAIAIALEYEIAQIDSKECYFKSLAVELKTKRDYMAKFLQEAGMKVTVPEGGFFMIADWTNLAHKVDFSTETDSQRDYRFTKWMIRNLGLQGIPPSAFYCQSHKSMGENYVRYCFFKKDENLDRAAEIFKNWK